ncbi:TPA: hypothetical protein ACIRVE_005375 [Pseudomonas putida]
MLLAADLLLDLVRRWSTCSDRRACRRWPPKPTRPGNTSWKNAALARSIERAAGSRSAAAGPGQPLVDLQRSVALQVVATEADAAGQRILERTSPRRNTAAADRYQYAFQGVPLRGRLS